MPNHAKCWTPFVNSRVSFQVTSKSISTLPYMISAQYPIASHNIPYLLVIWYIAIEHGPQKKAYIRIYIMFFISMKGDAFPVGCGPLPEANVESSLSRISLSLLSWQKKSSEPGGPEGGAKSAAPQHPCGGTAPCASSARSSGRDGRCGSLCAESGMWWDKVGYVLTGKKRWMHSKQDEAQSGV